MLHHIETAPNLSAKPFFINGCAPHKIESELFKLDKGNERGPNWRR